MFSINLQTSTAELNALEEQSSEKNVWHCCQKVCDRVDEAPAPHGYMTADVTPKPGTVNSMSINEGLC